MCRFHVQTAGSSLTAQSVDNNVVRTTIAGPLGRARGRPEPAHQLARRGARAADRGGRPARPAHAADPGLRVGRDRDARSARGQLLRRDADRPARGGRQRLPGGDRRAWAAPWRRSRRASSSARSRSRPTATSARSRRRSGSWSASTASSTRRRPHPPLQRIDPAGRARAGRAASSGYGRSATGAAWVEPLDRLARGGAGHGQPAARRSSRPSRRYATLGEISDRLRVAWGEHRELITV